MVKLQLIPTRGHVPDKMIKKLAHDTFASLKVRNFRIYFAGLIISHSGAWMQTVAFGWLALQMTGSGAQLGAIIAVQFLPLLVFGSWAGVLVDRLDKRRVVSLSQWAAAIVALAMSWVIWAGWASVAALYIFALISGFVRIFDNVGRQTFVFEMVDEKLLKNAISLNSVCINIARVVGPTIGGFAILAFGIPASFFLNGIFYLAVIVTMLFIRESELHHRARAPKKAGQLAEGFRYAWTTPLIRDTLFLVLILGTFTFEWQVSLPLFAERTFAGGAESYAALMSAFGAGAIFGGLFAASRHKISPHVFVLSVFLFGISIVITSFLPTLGYALIGMGAVGFFAISVMSTANSMIQLEAEPHMRGRVMALWTIAMQGSTPIGGPIVGIIGQYLGARWSLGIGGVAALIAAAIAAYPLLRKEKTYVVPEGVRVESEAAASGERVEVEEIFGETGRG
ncbi:MAG: MFS transporter [Candidatus Liptonbacteria bacterium]|nr:MFS transporter [Candidatus Liptonbacteria bacterium]